MVKFSDEDLGFIRYAVMILVENLARNDNPFMSYTELSEKVDEACGIWRSPQDLGPLLGKIQEHCKNEELPCLPSLVVEQGTTTPREGFMIGYRGLFPELAPVRDESIIRMEQIRCMECAYWYGLYECVELPEEVPVMPEREHYLRIVREG